ncbi:uncharacterized protein PITG_14479 [Phytophthora infestans T30-4]|uniref:NAD(P)-binding domain-containing protein n=1 Tax=Phytophthora infestans (strain T30-4) TaxID=403677 RepID=D0NPY4_PHYIT|nr:uncharacterized protein PITG_14479 [Phytophthora infestans T30-4]EEY62696.1 conserved hypothetical protein [Phytophthora infestans T30-4]|eukprot:XP_002898938.1 conserved hypothetical protein [Phytophthora infestans T30-4]
MPKYVLTGADGNLGGVAADFAIEIAKPEDELVFTSYTLDIIPADKLKLWQDKGVKVVAANYDEPETFRSVFQDAEAVSFISTWLIGDRRRTQAKNVIDTAKACGVKRICYTSFVGAGSTAENEEDIPFLPRDHHFVEQQIYASGLQYSVQRNFLYADNIPNFFAPSWKFTENRWLINTHGARGRVRRHVRRGAQVVLAGPINVYGDFSQLPMKLCIGDLLCSGEMVANGSMSKTSDTIEKLTGRKPTHWKDAMLKYRDIFPKPELALEALIGGIVAV